MKVTMPLVNHVHVTASDMSGCTMYLATTKLSGEAVTLMRVYDEVVVFANGSTTTYVSPNGRGKFDSGWIDRHYDIVREYKAGDSLTIAV